MKIEDMEKEYKDAQFQVILDLEKKIKKLEDENKSLQVMLEGTVPSLYDTSQNIGVSNERIICETQITILKNRAVNQELTLEETRKLQIYVDVLEKLKQKKDDGIKVEQISEQTLLELVKK